MMNRKAPKMATYEAPAITGARKVTGRLDEGRSLLPQSDAEIKHGVKPVQAYEAPTINDRREFRGSLNEFSNREP